MLFVDPLRQKFHQLENLDLGYPFLDDLRNRSPVLEFPRKRVERLHKGILLRYDDVQPLLIIQQIIDDDFVSADNLILAVE